MSSDAAEPVANAPGERGDLGALGEDAAVEEHQELDGFNAAAIAGERAIVDGELVREVLDGVAEFFEGVSGFRADSAADNRGGAGDSRRVAEFGRGSDHAMNPQSVPRPRSGKREMTDVPGPKMKRSEYAVSIREMK